VDPRRAPPELLLAVAGAVALVAIVQTLRLALRGWLRRRRLASARERGALGEVRAEALLRRLGYTILGRQVGVTYGLGVDGERVPVDLRADYVVAEGGRRYVAEVKTGVFAPRIETAATRRQLLEYRIAFDVDGVLLVDADAERVRLIEFPLPVGARSGGEGGWLGWAAGVVAGIAAGVLAMLVARAL
jgi:hypothetical protein